MEITTNTSITITINGTNYTFANPHPIEDLIDQLNNETNALALWQQRITDSQNRINDLNSKITALCVTPV